MFCFVLKCSTFERVCIPKRLLDGGPVFYPPDYTVVYFLIFYYTDQWLNGFQCILTWSCSFFSWTLLILKLGFYNCLCLSFSEIYAVLYLVLLISSPLLCKLIHLGYSPGKELWLNSFGLDCSIGLYILMYLHDSVIFYDNVLWICLSCFLNVKIIVVGGGGFCYL